MVRFLVVFGILYGLFFWLLTGSGPIPVFNQAVHGLTRGQAAVSGWILGLLGEPVMVSGTVLVTDGFSCDVDEGCNGMTAVWLLVAGILSFPERWKLKIMGIVALVPVVLLVNLVRIMGLYWIGSHVPRWFNASHVYVGQVLVIVLTAALWWSWLNRVSRGHASLPSVSSS